MRYVFPDIPRWQSGAPEGRWWIAAWLPVIIALAVISAESTEVFSAANTSSWLRPIFERVLGHFRDNNWEQFHHYLRKTGHFVGYGIVALTFLRAWLYTLGRQSRLTLLGWRIQSTALAIVCTAIVASCDEFHQTFLPGRTGTPVDVALDTCGATTLCLLAWLICFRGSVRGAEPISADV